MSVHPLRCDSSWSGGRRRWVRTSSVSAPRANSSTVTTVGRRSVCAEIQVNERREGGSITRYSPQCSASPRLWCMTIRNLPPTRGSSSTVARLMSPGHIQRAMRSGSSHAANTRSRGTRSTRRTTSGSASAGVIAEQCLQGVEAGMPERPLARQPPRRLAQRLAARTQLLAKEKEFTRAKDELNRLRRALPWERVEKSYVFEGPDGKETLAQLFAGKSQLLVYHFMFGPEEQEGCPSCSFWADHYDGAGLHLPHRDVSLVVVSRAPLAKIERFKRRMGWRFKWVSSADTDFNFDLGVSFTPDQVKRGANVYNYQTTNPGVPDREGASVFYKDRSG